MTRERHKRVYCAAKELVEKDPEKLFDLLMDAFLLANDRPASFTPEAYLVNVAHGVGVPR